ncbi:hypothetical protein EVAR_13908_1 [Eumeta japonica]|uniref:RNA-directed DNA polymerase n=1 Tax=Eumeta variegata TaxID=151549 RepID=A0A4C1U8I3_EUMVA|nr:hypothetical protein EVAR_13908_1 [Eumeta japonica]
MEQGSVRADIFITRVRALFAKLPYELSEITKIDIVYGLLDRRIRKRVPRELIHSLDVLVNKSRLVEESLAEAVTTKAGAADRVSAPGRLPGTGRVEWPARAATASSPSAGGRAAACSAPSMSHAASSRVTPRPALDTSSAVSPGVATARASDNGDTHPRALSNIRQLRETPHDERPIAYASRLLTSAERNYSTTEREALAVWAVESSEDLLMSSSFETEARESCDVCTVLIDTPWEATALRKDQLDDPELSKIIIGLENTNDLEVNRWTERGYHMCKGVLYRYTDTETEEPQLVVPENRRKQVMVECHDSATAGHGGINKTLHRISQQFYFPGMRRYVINYLKTCVECQRYKPDNLKPMGLLQTPVPAQRFEVVAVDLFGPLPKGPKGERWVMIMEDTASKWIELFPLADATAEACAKVLIEEVFLRFGVPRRMVSDNGVQFVADVMQKAMFILSVKQNLIPLYHPEANPVERKNRDLKTQLAILVEGHHNRWPEFLPFIRFAMNTALTKATLKTPAYLTFGRELRSPLTAQSDLRSVIEAENYIPQITPYLLKLVDTLQNSKESAERQQDLRKSLKDKSRRDGTLIVGDLVLMKTHVLSSSIKGVTTKFVPKRDGPYLIHKKVSPTTYLLAYPETPDKPIGKYHISDLKKYHAREDACSNVPEPVIPKRRRGYPFIDNEANQVDTSGNDLQEQSTPKSFGTESDQGVPDVHPVINETGAGAGFYSPDAGFNRPNVFPNPSGAFPYGPGIVPNGPGPGPYGPGPGPFGPHPGPYGPGTGPYGSGPIPGNQGSYGPNPQYLGPNVGPYGPVSPYGPAPGQNGPSQGIYGTGPVAYGPGQGLFVPGTGNLGPGQGIGSPGQGSYFQGPVGPGQGLGGSGQMPFSPGQGLDGSGQMPFGPGQGLGGSGQMPFGPGQGLYGPGQGLYGPGQGTMGQGNFPGYRPDTGMTHRGGYQEHGY